MLDDCSAMHRPLVSIVTPFYNTEAYLGECIESVINQTYQNWEYILVNNRSTDRSHEIANAYAHKDSRIKVAMNDFFLNQMQNYNNALRMISAQSKYCKIVQADDWIFSNCIIEMVEVAESNPTVGIIGAYRLDDKMVNCDGLPYPSTVVSGREICRLSLLNNLFVFGSPNSILFRSDIVRSRDPFYNEASRHPDTEACYEILQNCDFGFVHKVLTFTRRENESISTVVRRYDPQHLLDKLIIVIKYGRCYLNYIEYDNCLSSIENEYYSFLGERLWCKDRIDFLEYHREGLSNIGNKISLTKVAKFAFIKFIHFIINPVRITHRIFKLISGNKV